MKLALISAALSIATLLTPQATALTITDPFTNSANWGSPFAESGKSLVVTNGRMNFVSSTTAGGGGGIARNTPFLTTTQDWSIKVDVHVNPFVITNGDQGVSVFLGVGKTSDYLGTHVLLGFDRDSYDPNYYGINDDVQVNDVSIPGFTNLNYLPSGDAALRLDFNAANQTITYSYDANGAAGGYNWIAMGTTNIASGTYNLQLGPADTLSVLLAGWSNMQVVTNGQAYLDNLEITVVDTGSLRVTISPTNAVIAGAQWQVDGGDWQNHSNVVSNLTPGNHTVAYKPISGWNTPASQTVVVTAGATAVTNGIYTPQTGSIQVTINPAGAVSAGAQWQVDGGAWQNSGNSVSNLTVGNHTLAFKPISGWNTPTNQTVLVAANTTTVTNGSYVQQTGSLLVTIDPANAVTAGAQWQVDGGAWQNSGTMVSGLAVGNHTVSFKNIPDWFAPASQWVVVAPNSTATANGVYSPVGQPIFPGPIQCLLQGGSLLLTYPAVPGQVYILQYTDDLTPPRAWRSYLSLIGVPSASFLTFVVPASEVPTRYFRVSVGGSYAAVYSVNVVGYVRRVVQPGLNLMANPLYSCSDNSIGSLFPNCPPNSEILLPAPNGALIPESVFSGGAWDVPNLNLSPGQGFGFENSGAAFEVIFAGEVVQSAMTSLPPGLSLIGSKVPVNELLNFPAQNGDEITTWNATNQTPLLHDYFGGDWQPAAPAIRPAEAFWVQVSQFTQWTQSFDPWSDLELWEFPIITRQPASRTNSPGSTAHFAVQAIGGVHYQWRKNGTNLSPADRILGVNADLLVLTNIQSGDSGNYSVVITNFYGSVTSSIATLTIQLPPLLIVSTNGSFGVSNGIFGFTLTGSPGQTVVTEVSTNLSVWQPLKTNVLTTGSVYFSDPQWTNHPRRFYRIRSQ